MIKIFNKEKTKDARKLIAAMYLVIAFSFFPVFYPMENQADPVEKNVIAEETSSRQVILGGDAFGIKLYSKGVMVVEMII